MLAVIPYSSSALPVLHYRTQTPEESPLKKNAELLKTVTEAFREQDWINQADGKTCYTSPLMLPYKAMTFGKQQYTDANAALKLKFFS